MHLYFIVVVVSVELEEDVLSSIEDELKQIQAQIEAAVIARNFALVAELGEKGKKLEEMKSQQCVNK